MHCRSYLFVPGNRPERFEKAVRSGADGVVIDLEDAVGASDKSVAREHAGAWLAGGGRAVVRINAVDTAWFDADLDMCRRAGALAVMLPKADSVEFVRCAAARSGAMVLPLIESAAGLAAARVIAGTQGVQRLVFGSLDLQLDMGMEACEDELLPFRCELVLASRLAGIAAPVDGVTVDLRDATRLRQDCERSRRLGFGAKLCIHPSQVEIVGQAFSPSAEQLEKARAVLRAAGSANGPGNAVSLNGEMVDLPVILRARRILESVQSPPALSFVRQKPCFRSKPT